MSEDDLDTMFGQEAPAEAEVQEAVAPPEELPVEPEAKGEEEAAPPAAVDEQGQRIPISALLDERDKRKAAQQELEEMRRWKQQIEAQAQEHQRRAAEKDPARMAQMQQAGIQDMLWQERLNMSEALARSQHGEDIVTEAQQAYIAAMQASPALYAELQRHANPYAYVVDWHKKQKAIETFGTDPEAFKAKVIEEYLAQQTAQAAPAPSSAKPNLPPSMASAPAAGGQTTTSGSLFDQMIGG